MGSTDAQGSGDHGSPDDQPGRADSMLGRQQGLLRRAEEEPGRGVHRCGRVDDRQDEEGQGQGAVRGQGRLAVDYVEKAEAAKSDPSKTKDLAAQAGKIKTASDAITKHAKDKCNLELKS